MREIAPSPFGGKLDIKGFRELAGWTKERGNPKIAARLNVWWKVPRAAHVATGCMGLCREPGIPAQTDGAAKPIFSASWRTRSPSLQRMIKRFRVLTIAKAFPWSMRRRTGQQSQALMPHDRTPVTFDRAQLLGA
jgi:hypothetical protein